MKDDREILNEFATIVRQDIVDSLVAKGRKASGKTEKEIIAAATSDTAVVSGPPHINYLEFGRKPTSAGATQGEETVFQRIKQWISDKGLDLNPYAVTKQIHKKGYPGKPGVLSEPLGDANLSGRLNVTMEELADNQVNIVLKLLGLDQLKD